MPVHTIITILAVILSTATVFQLTQRAPAQAATGIFAQFPFQGRLTNTDGTVVANANYDVVFKLYTVSTGGTDVWSESHTGGNQISTSSGIFNTMLGSISTLAGIDFNQDEYWLGITVGADAEMAPRIRLGASPYAFNSDKLDGVSAENFLQLPGQAGGQTAFGGTAASENLVLRSTSNATKGSVLLADDGGSVRVGTAGNASLNVPGAGASSQTLGVGAVASGSLGSIAVGNSSSASTYEALAVGFVADASGYMSTAIGGRAEATALHAIALGNRSTADEDNSFVIGDNFEAGYETKNIYFGYGRVSTFAPLQTSTLNATGGLGTNVSGTALQLAGGRGTGSADGGSVRIATAPAGGSGSSLNALIDRLTVTTAGNIVPGTGALATSATDGFMYLGTMAGVPTGVPTSFLGRVPLTYDSGANTLYAYNSGWQALGGGGGGITGSGAAGRVTVWNGASSVTSDTEFLWNTSSNSLSLGLTPASTGVVRLPNDERVTWRDNAGGDKGIKLDSSNNWNFDVNLSNLTVTSASSLQEFQVLSPIGRANVNVEGVLRVYNSDDFASPPASTGVVRLPNDERVTWRDNAGGDKGIKLDSSNNWNFDVNLSNLTVTSASSLQEFQVLSPIGAANVNVEGALRVYHADNLTSSVASTGIIRLPNDEKVTWRNAANTADMGIKLNASNQWELSSVGGFGTDVNVVTDALGGTPTNFSILSPGSGIIDLKVEGAVKAYNSSDFAGSVASTGNIRLPNNAYTTWRNAANTGDRGIRLDTSNQWEFASQGGFGTDTVFVTDALGGTPTNFTMYSPGSGIVDLKVEGAIKAYNSSDFASTIASTGNIRLPNNAYTMWRNAANTADMGIKLNASNQWELSSVGGFGTDVNVVTDALGGTPTNFSILSPGSGIIDLKVEGAVKAYNSSDFAGSVSSTGAVRLPNNQWIASRNAADSADVNMFKVNASNQLEFGATDNLFDGGGTFQGNVLPSTDDTYDLGSSSLRWRDLYVGPTSLHLTTTVAETATARDWKLNVDETNGATDGDLRIQEGSNSYFTVSTAGNIVLGSAALGTSATNGFLYMASMAGTPTGAPTSYTGRTPFTYDSTNNLLYAYNGGAWQQLTSMSGGAIVLNEISAPSATTNKGKLYVKSITGGNSVFFKDENGAETDLVNDKIKTAESLRTIRGSVAANGTILSGTGFSIVKNATGDYTITFTTAFSTTPTVTTSSDYGTLNFSTANSYSVGTSSAGIKTSEQTLGILVATDEPFNFIVIGTP